MKLTFLLFSVLFTTAALQAQDNLSPADKQTAYAKTIHTRAEKIVTSLNLTDWEKAASVTDLVAAQYRDLNTVYTSHDEQVKNAKRSLASDKDALTARLKAIEDETTKATKALHTAYLQNLSKELKPEQIERIKDGMTYNVLNVTYSAYMSMLPNLTAAQKEQIKQWLMEARENAMDAESSEKKHGWFGKYKGRINNYLSAAGYDMKKEGEAWQKRLAEEKQQKTN
jgi:hypothetical protein